MRGVERRWRWREERKRGARGLKNKLKMTDTDIKRIDRTGITCVISGDHKTDGRMA